MNTAFAPGNGFGQTIAGAARLHRAPYAIGSRRRFPLKHLEFETLAERPSSSADVDDALFSQWPEATLPSLRIPASSGSSRPSLDAIGDPIADTWFK